MVALTVRSGVRYPPLSPAPPPPVEVLYRVTDYGGPDLARTDNYERWGWVFEKSRLLRRSNFKIYGSYGGLFIFMLLDDYRVCVKKRNFYRPPSAAPSVT